MTSIDAGMPMHVAFISPIVTNSARRSHDIIQSDVLLCRTTIQSSSDNTSMRVCLSLSFRECLCTPLLCCNACHSYACTAPKSILAQQGATPTDGLLLGAALSYFDGLRFAM